jgi:predicted nucleic acid-binding Zn ribbon protein
MSDAPLVTCPYCEHDTLERVVSGGAGVIYKGEGWYVTDYSKKSSGGKDSGAPAESAPGKESKPATEGAMATASETKVETSVPAKTAAPAPKSTEE